MNKIKVVIPAMYSSTRLLGKPQLDLCSKSVIWQVVQQWITIDIPLKYIIVATDDAHIYGVLNAESIPVRIISSRYRSGNNKINGIVVSEWWEEDQIDLNTQGDAPLIPSELINKLLIFLENRHYSITTTVTNHQDFNNRKVVKAILSNDNRALYFTRSPSSINCDKPYERWHFVM